MTPLTADAGDASLRSKVFRSIEQAVIDGTYAPGESLTELRLSAELGVSRTPIREALRQLELEGLVRNIPNKGVVVVGISAKDVEDIYDIRVAVEGLAARWAAENATEEEIAAMRELVELQEYYVSRNDAPQVRRLDSSFHACLYDSSRSRPLRLMLASFHNYIRKAREMSVRAAGRAAVSVAEHRRIWEAIAARDPAAAEEAARAHIRSAKASVIALQDQPVFCEKDMDKREGTA